MSASNVQPIRARPRGRAPLLILFIVAALLGIGRWWQVRERRQWLASATTDELAAAAPHHLNDVEIFERLGARAAEGEQWARAAKAYQHASELAPDRVEDWVGWARAIYEFGGYRPAEAILTTFIQQHPRDTRAYLERASLRRMAKRTELAWHDADQATRLDPSSGKAWALRGDLCLDQGIAGEGEISFRKARDLTPNSAWPYVGLYQAYVNEKKLPEALEIARVIVQRFPDVIEGKLYLGEALILNAKRPEDYDEARQALNDMAVRSNDLRVRDRSALHQLLGRAYFNQRRWSEALLHFQKADSIAPGNPDTLFLLGRTYRALGDTAHADATLKRYRQVYDDTAVVRQYGAKINANPNDANARLEFARWYVRHGIPQSAIIQYEEMIARGLEVETARRELKTLEQSGAAP